MDTYYNSASILNRSVLVLNTNYAPMDICTAKRAICLYFNEKVDIVEEDLEENLPKSDFVPNLLQLCQLL